MEKEFIPYEQALALKELGFDFEDNNILGFYSIKYGVTTHQQLTKNDGYNPAILYQQAFRWFREKYNYYISVFRTHDGSWGVDLWLLGVHKPKATIFSETYEEAELACLNKLIEIVKL